MPVEAQGAERAIISILFKHPDRLFSIDDVLTEADFVNTGSSMIFGILKDIILKEENPSIDTHLIVTEAEKRGLDDFAHFTLNGELVEAVSKMTVNPNNLGRFVSDVKQASIKRALINKCEDLKDDIENYVGPSLELRNMVENGILSSINKIDSGQDDILCLADDFEEVILAYADRDKKIGVDLGFQRWQEDIGFIRNGAITGVFASTKVGKSQFAMWAKFQTALLRRQPVLYLDTELQARQQQMRLCGIISAIPYNVIESGEWKYNAEMVDRIKKAFKIVKDAPIYYKNIAGRSVHSVIPTIRKFTYQHLGGPIKGDEPKGLVIYDYIKLMDHTDMAMRNIQEYQLIGLLMSGLHDCCANLNIPIITLGQLNKQGNVGIQRVVENVDSATFLMPKTSEQLQEDGPNRGSHLLEVKYSRNGPGHDFDEWINLHFDKSCGQFKEDKRNSEVVTVVKKIKEDMEKQDMQKLADANENK